MYSANATSSKHLTCFAVLFFCCSKQVATYCSTVNTYKGKTLTLIQEAHVTFYITNSCRLLKKEEK